VIGASPLLRRIAAEHRRTFTTLALLFAANLALYAFVVYPLGQRVANIEQRDQTAAQGLAAARADHAQATGTLTGKDRASTELATFYREVLPADLSGARRLIHLRLQQLARQSGMQFQRWQFERVEDRDSTLSSLRTEMILSGSYDDMRTFIHELETAPEFVVIENVSLAEEDANAGALVVTLQLATYFQDEGR
jgi:Tfp pilus assembly protein PilO